jgi:hypothetical protein
MIFKIKIKLVELLQSNSFEWHDLDIDDSLEPPLVTWVYVDLLLDCNFIVK